MEDAWLESAKKYANEEDKNFLDALDHWSTQMSTDDWFERSTNDLNYVIDAIEEAKDRAEDKDKENNDQNKRKSIQENYTNALNIKGK